MATITLPFNPVTGGGSFAYDAGVLSHLVGGARTAFGLSKGGLEFNPNVEVRQPEYDGRRVMVAGLDRVIGFGAEMSGTIITVTDDILEKLVMGGPAVGGLWRPTNANVSIAKESLIVAPQLELARSDGTGIYVAFPFGYVTEWSASTTDKEEAEIEFTLQSRVDAEAVGFTGLQSDYVIGLLDAAA